MSVSVLRSQQRQQRTQRGLGLADEVHLGRIAHPDRAAVDVDLHGAGLTEIGEELRGTAGWSPTISSVSQSRMSS